MKHKFLLFIVVLVFCSCFCMVTYGQEEIVIEWVWGSTQLYQSHGMDFSITVSSNSYQQKSTEVMILIHYAWMKANSFVIHHYNESFARVNSFSFSTAVPSDIPLGETDDFACIVLYKNSTNTLFDSSVVRAPTVTINRGRGLYVEQEIYPSSVVGITISFFFLVITLWVWRKKLGLFLKKKSRFIPLFVFLTSFTIYVISIYSNFGPWFVSDSIRNGFAIYGDEPHFMFATEALLKGDLNMNNTYPWRFTQHSKWGYGLFTKGILISGHEFGYPVLLTIPYSIGNFFGLKVFGAMIFGAFVMSLTNLTIYKMSLRLSNSVKLSLITAFTFGFSTLLFVWAGQIFSEVVVSFLITFVTYKILVASKKLDLIVVGLLLGCLPFFKRQTIVLSVIVLILLSVSLFKRKEKKNLKYLLTSFALMTIVFILYIVCILGFENAALFTGGGQVISLPPVVMTLGYPISKCFYFGLVGLWIDSNVGVLFYSPVVILSFLGLSEFIKRNTKLFVAVVFSLFGLWYLGIGLIGYWHGWLSPPGRYMTCVLPLLSIPFVYSLKKFGTNKLFKLIFLGLCLAGLITSGLIAFNRLLGYSVIFVHGVMRCRYILCFGRAFGINIRPLPEFAYAWYKGGGIGSIPQSPWLLGSWSVFFLCTISALLVVGHKPDLFGRVRKKMSKVTRGPIVISLGTKKKGGRKLKKKNP